MNKLFPQCVFYPKRGYNYGTQCRKETTEDTGFCSSHLTFVTTCNSTKRNIILHEACFGNDVELLNKCLTHLPLTEKEIDIEFEEIMKSGFKEKVGKMLLLSPKYFPSLELIKGYLHKSCSKRLIYFILYKRFLMKLYLESQSEILPGLEKIIPRLLDPNNMS